jgi:predicted dithiol-disulfide oxidoreductase (DUF899 family)
MMPKVAMEQPKVVTREQWLKARNELLAKEKKLTHEQDAVNAERRALPWVKVEKDYVFDTQQGKKSLADLFDGRSQLIVKHFMFGPGWKEGCVGCSFEVDHIEGALAHLEHHDVSFVAISRAPLSEIEPFKKRMGWHFDWVSSFDTDFNFDYQVSVKKNKSTGENIDANSKAQDVEIGEGSAISVFYKNAAGEVFHTYSTFGRGTEKAVTTYMYLDLTPKGRNETGPRHNLTDWVRHHDRYGAGGVVNADGRYQAAPKST